MARSNSWELNSIIRYTSHSMRLQRSYVFILHDFFYFGGFPFRAYLQHLGMAVAAEAATRITIASDCFRLQVYLSPLACSRATKIVSVRHTAAGTIFASNGMVHAHAHAMSHAACFSYASSCIFFHLHASRHASVFTASFSRIADSGNSGKSEA